MNMRDNTCHGHVQIRNDLHGKYLHFTCEYTRGTTRGISRMCEVVVELYHSSKESYYSILI